MKLVSKVVLTSFVSLLSYGAVAETPAKAAVCGACHGPTGDKPIMDAYPKLAGQNKGYLIGALKAYRAGQRTGGMAPVMGVQAKTLTDAEITGLAEFYSAQ